MLALPIYKHNLFGFEPQVYKVFAVHYKSQNVTLNVKFYNTICNEGLSIKQTAVDKLIDAEYYA